MKSTKEKINKIEEALRAAYRRPEEPQLPRHWRKQVMQEISLMARWAPAPTGRAIATQGGRRILSFAAGAAVGALLMWLIVVHLDWYDPWITLKPAINVVERRAEFLLAAGDLDSGLRSLQVHIIQEGKEIEVASRTFAPPEGFLGHRGSIKQVEFPLLLDALALGLREGQATLQVKVCDSSWRNWFQGRVTTYKLDVKVNLPPPSQRGRTPADPGGGQ
jgi:hypothetical protein